MLNHAKVSWEPNPWPMMTPSNYQLQLAASLMFHA
jgi:hypothetical protein